MRFFVVSLLLVFGFSFIKTELVDSFSTCSDFFLNEQPPVIPGILENSTSQDNNRYKLICQKYQNAYRFATLYDTQEKIPVFSAYRYTGSYKGRPHNPWMIEPQLETYGAAMREPCVNQAFPGDYWAQKSMTQAQLTRGHFFPNCHAADRITAESTFTLTNTAPQYDSFNKGSWNKTEITVRTTMNSHCRNESDHISAYVLTGAVPSGPKSKLLNKRVNIPSSMWTVFCCYNSKTSTWESQAHWANNKDEKNKENTIKPRSVEELQEFMKETYGSLSLFHGVDCSKI
ncbi:endonuclease domain-containing 1 protein-like [Carassius carassius]|uniref:endonuclease domain-containing 1 protein-like n=1 Tax=Carassius carassius TaxID=217509 RepID=UPI0028691F86|nr:endonuclease domain-containing 1 protein-like [Carassius carassius]